MIILSTLATVAIALAALGILAVALSTQGFAGRPPTGADAMGLAAVAFAGIIAYLLLLAAAWLVAARGGLVWLAPSRPMAALLITIVTVGLFLATAVAFTKWGRPGWSVPVLFIGGTLAPLAFGALLLAGAWMPVGDDAPKVAPRLVAAPLALVALAGFVTGAIAWAELIRDRIEVAAKVRADDDRKAAERARLAALPSGERTRETFKTFGPPTELWAVCTYLLGERDADERAAIVERCRLVPDLDGQVVQTLGSEWPVYRVGALEFARLDGRDVGAWGPGLLKGVELVIEQLRAGIPLSGGKTMEDGPSASPLRQIENFAALAPRWPGAAEPIGRLRAAVEATPASPERERAIAALEAAR